MIAFLQGPLLALGEQTAIIKAGPVGYLVKLAPGLVEDLRPASIDGRQVDLYIHHRITEASQDLFGFRSLQDVDLFLKLLGVHGVGPKVALVVAEYPDAIQQGDIAALKALPGVGPKTAALITRELVGKINVEASRPNGRKIAMKASAPAPEGMFFRLSEALTTLGYKGEARQRMLELAQQNAEPDMTEGELVKLALRYAERAA